MLGIEFQKPEVTTVIRWLLRFILVLFLAWLVRQRAEQEEEECEETESDVADARARSNGLRSRGSTRPTTRLQPRRDTYNTSARQRKGVSSNESPDLDAIIEKVSKPKEMWQPRRSGEPLLLKKQDEADGTERERVAASASKPARDAQNGMTLHGHERPVTFIGFNAESNLLFSCGKDKIVCVWSFPAGELLGSYKGHNGAVWCCSATFDSRWLVTCGADRLVIVWEARTSRELARVELPGVVRCVEWAGAVAGVNASDVSERFVTCHNRFGAHPPALTVWRFDGKAIQELIVVPKLPSAANQVRWGRANYFIASAHDSGELIFWRADTGAEVKRLKAHDAGISKFDFNDDRELVATVSHDMSVCVWDVGKGVEWKLLYKAQTDRPLNAVALGPISRSAAVGAIEDRPREVCVIAAGGQDVRDVARSSSATEQFGTLLFRLGTSKVPGQLQGDGVTNKGHFGPVHTLAFASNGTAMASGSEDGFVRVHVFEKAGAPSGTDRDKAMRPSGRALGRCLMWPDLLDTGLVLC
ncbi:unnamed protein product [Durusdinium trenchii]|uniref:Serine-threonine kinase receptor-associated protein n=1 Tax=Durusdinium trenchii TaxID=1381693 RepID=A0ABP0I4W1_9DINO